MKKGERGALRAPLSLMRSFRLRKVSPPRASFVVAFLPQICNNRPCGLCIESRPKKPIFELSTAIILLVFLARYIIWLRFMHSTAKCYYIPYVSWLKPAYKNDLKWSCSGSLAREVRITETLSSGPLRLGCQWSRTLTTEYSEQQKVSLVYAN